MNSNLRRNLENYQEYYEFSCLERDSFKVALEDMKRKRENTQDDANDDNLEASPKKARVDLSNNFLNLAATDLAFHVRLRREITFRLLYLPSMTCGIHLAMTALTVLKPLENHWNRNWLNLRKCWKKNWPPKIFQYLYFIVV